MDRRRNAREFVEHRADVVLIVNKNMAGSCGFACPQLTNVLTLWNSPSRSAKLTVCHLKTISTATGSVDR